MVSHPSPVLVALSLLLLTAADGRKIQASVDGNSFTTSRTSLLDSTYNYDRPTDPNDVMALMKLINQFPQLTEVQFPSMTKDPCYPHKLTWITCSNDSSTRRVTALYLGNKNLHGPVPDFSSMDALETIHLHQNSLSGPIPGFFSTFPKLKHLNLANNSFTGPIPDSLSNNKKITLTVSVSLSGNCGYPYYYCAPPFDYTQFLPPPNPYTYGGGGSFNYPVATTRKKSNLPKILGFSIPPGLLAAIGGGFCCARCRK